MPRPNGLRGPWSAPSYDNYEAIGGELGAATRQMKRMRGRLGLALFHIRYLSRCSHRTTLHGVGLLTVQVCVATGGRWGKITTKTDPITALKRMEILVLRDERDRARAISGAFRDHYADPPRHPSEQNSQSGSGRYHVRREMYGGSNSLDRLSANCRVKLEINKRRVILLVKSEMSSKIGPKAAVDDIVRRHCLQITAPTIVRPMALHRAIRAKTTDQLLKMKKPIYPSWVRNSLVRTPPTPSTLLSLILPL